MAGERSAGQTGHRFLPMSKTLLAGYRLARLGAHLVRGVVIVAWRFPNLSAAQKSERIQAWALALLAQVAIKFEVKGSPPESGPMLLVANHISWLDIAMLLAAGHCRFVAKSEIAHWPLLGLLTRAAGTLFIARESRRDAFRVVHHMAEELRSGQVLAIFPEGTTSDGRHMLPFHANLFQAAISAHAPVQPVALRFVDAATGQLSLAPCYIDDDSLLGSVWRTLKAPPLCATLTFGAPQASIGRERRALAGEVRAVIEGLLRTGSGNQLASADVPRQRTAWESVSSAVAMRKDGR